MYRILELHFVL
uniref:Uncharacterized protein n=1 Tax=Anguilla anguilla TaxID=7936 RepID=A0A0E9W3T5_ANGAN